MRRITGAFLLSITLVSCDQAEPSQSPNQDDSSLVTFADSLLQNNLDSANLAGSAILIYKDGKALLDKSYGFASLELGVAIPENASFEIGSVTKQFTAAAILRLVKEGKLSLSDDITDYLEFDTKGRAVTINQLLNHTSGIASYTEMEDFWPISLHNYERDTMLHVVEQGGFLFEPGEALIYNNSAYFFLGLIIEKVSEKSYEEYLSEQFFVPLGMNNTYYCTNTDVIKNKVYGYGYSPVGLQQKAYLDHTWPFAAGSLSSTTEDLRKWLTGLHNGEVFDEEDYALMTTPTTLYDGTALRYAMGLAVFNDNGYRRISHGGGINGFLTATRYYPDEDLYVIVLVNTTGPAGADFIADKLTWEIMEKQDPVSVTEDAALMIEAGDYSGPVRGRDITIEVSSIGNSLILVTKGESDPDTISTYLGDNTWANKNEIIKLENEKLKIDQIYGNYILSKN